MSAKKPPLLRFHWRLILPVVGGAALALGLGMLVCAGLALGYGDGSALALAIPGVGSILLGGGGLYAGRHLDELPLRSRDGFLAVTLTWVVGAAVSSLPFIFHGMLPSFTDAYFEAMSGFTTTGSTMLDVIDGQPEGLMMWRQMTQWLGGIGIVVLVVAIAPATGLASQRMFYAETSGVTADRLTPKIADTAKILWAVYVGLSVAAVIAFLAAGMGLYDAVAHMFTTLATGGFSPKGGSIADFDSLAVEIAVIVFMALSGINFAFYWKAVTGKGLFPQFAEVRVYLSILAVATLVVATSLVVSDHVNSIGQGLRESAFTVTSLMTTTGYTTADYDVWNDFVRLGLIILMFVGACAGSTTGGMKVIRVVLLAKSAAQEVRRQLQPARVSILRLGGKTFGDGVREGLLGFFFIYVMVFIVATMLLLALGLDMISAFSAVAATLNVIGPGLEQVGASESFQAVPDAGKWVLSACMLIGRLEVFTVIALLAPSFWRRRGA
ncbi:MAG: TrkH family potassium uptake protein [Solirubrobacterales bacterium]